MPLQAGANVLEDIAVVKNQSRDCRKARDFLMFRFPDMQTEQTAFVRFGEPEIQTTAEIRALQRFAPQEVIYTKALPPIVSLLAPYR